MIYDDYEENYQQLVYAIIRQAVIDYKIIFKKYLKDKRYKNELNHEKSFFYSDWFNTLSSLVGLDLNADEIIDAIENQVIAGNEKKGRKGKKNAKVV